MTGVLPYMEPGEVSNGNPRYWSLLFFCAWFPELKIHFCIIRFLFMHLYLLHIDNKVCGADVNAKKVIKKTTELSCFSKKVK